MRQTHENTDFPFFSQTDYTQQLVQPENALEFKTLDRLAISDSHYTLLNQILLLGITARRGTDRCVFIEYCGHINALYLTIKYSTIHFGQHDTLYRQEIRFNADMFGYNHKTPLTKHFAEIDEKIHNELLSMKHVLEHMQETGDIPIMN